MKLVHSFSEIFQHKKYNKIACDIYGVLHDGYLAYPYTVETLKKLQQLNQQVILLSNSSRMYPALSKQLETKFNISTFVYNDILSSGKLTRLFLQDCDTYLTKKVKNMDISCHATLRDSQQPSMTAIEFCQHYLVNKNNNNKIYRFFIAGDLDYLTPLFQDLTSFQPTDHWEDDEMDFVLLGSIQPLDKNNTTIIDTYNEESIQQHYMPFLKSCLKRNIPLVCVNPDVLAPHGTYDDGSQRLLICPGYIGAMYEAIGGKVLYFGKPFKSIYDYLLQDQKEQDQSILCVGDNINTDVLGATEANLDVVLILGGVHASSLLSLIDDEQQLIDQVRQLCQLENIQEPTYLMPYLKY